MINVRHLSNSFVALLVSLPAALFPEQTHAGQSFSSEQVEIPGPLENITLAGTLLVPKNATSATQVAGIVLVTGSGPQDRDETIFQKKPFKILAEGLVQHGFAVLRYDDRGTEALGLGSSTGSFTGSTTRDFAYDAASVIAYLAADQRIDENRIVVCGHSTGGLVAAMLLGDEAPLAAAILLASPGVRGAELLAHQTALMNRIANGVAAQPVAEQVLTQQAEIQEKLILSIVTDDESAMQQAAWNAIAHTIRSSGGDPESFDDATRQTAIRQALAPLKEVWMNAFLRYDPSEDLRAAKVPVFAVFGGLDLQVDPRQNAAPMSAALRDAGNPFSTVITIEQANHLFQTADTGLMTEYVTLEDEMQPLLVDLVAAWLNRALAK